MFNVYKNQQSRQTGSRNLMGPKTLPTIWYTYMTLVTKYQISAINRKMRRKISWTDGRTERRTDGQTDRGKTVYPPPPLGSGGIIRNSKRKKPKPSMPILSYYFTKPNTKKLTIKSMVLLFI
jgi:hypothetical protein